MKYKEHEYIETDVDIRDFPTIGEAVGSQRLGVFVEGRPLKLKANYYIGVTRLDEDTVLEVVPKIDNLDWRKMFEECLHSNYKDVNEKLPNIFGVEANQRPITTDKEKASVWVLNFLAALMAEMLKPILAKGFKRNFVRREDNLTGKIRGSIDFNQHLRKNIIGKREERIFCRYQEYDIDCLENQVLKRALKILLKDCHDIEQEQENILRRALRHLGEVSELKSVGQIRSLNINSIYIDYKRVLEVAKNIILFHGNDLTPKDEQKAFFMPYWINMPLLFELYALIKLREAYPNSEIKYHIRTYGNELDFVKKDENLIIDAKYIPKWEDSLNHSNIRQLAGYARHTTIRERVLDKKDDTTTILPVLIIYPTTNESQWGDVLLDKEHGTQSVDEYVLTFKRGLQVPTIQKAVE